MSGPFRINDKIEESYLNIRLGTSGNLGTSAVRNAAAPNGTATLDSNGKIPINQIPDSLTQTLTYNGLWNASSNTPTLTTSVPNSGNFYIVNVAGSRFGINWEVGDWIISDGDEWERVPNPAPVTSVQGRTGDVVINKSDVGLSNVDNVSAANLRARSSHTGTQPHTTITGLGSAATVNMGTGGANIRTNTQNDARFVQQSGYTAFNPNGDYSGLRARATTAADVGAPPTSRTFTAGNGLVGGGNFSGDRTFTLGTPSTISTSTTNSVTASSHTHELSLPVSATRWPTWNEVSNKPAVESPLTFNSSGAASVNRSGNTVTISATNTTYSAGDGISLSGTTFNLTNLAAGSSLVGALRYNGTSRSAGRMYGGTTAPTNSTRLNYDGRLYATRLYATSSLKYKNIERVDDLNESSDRVHKIGMLGVSVGNYKNDKTDELNRWLIAEDVAKVSPEVITFAEDGTPDALDYNQLVPDLYADAANTHLKIQTLQDEVKQLRELVSRLLEK